MEKITIRKIGKNDLTTAAKFQADLAQYHHRLDKIWQPGKKVYKERLAWTKKYFNDKNFLMLLVELDGQAVGFFSACETNAMQGMIYKRTGHIIHAIVDKKYRRLGIGKLSLDHIFKWFKSRKLRLIGLHVETRNLDGIKAWKKLGFKENIKKMYQII